MKSFLLALLTIAVFVNCNSMKGSGRIVRETRHTGHFQSVRASNGIEVEIRFGTDESVTVEADDNLIGYVQTNVVNGQLNIRTKGVSFRRAHIKVYVTVESLHALRANSAARIRVVEPMRSGGEIRFSTSSGSSITAVVDAPVVKAESSSGSNLELSGRTRNFKAESSSGSSLKAGNLLSEHTLVNASSGSNAYVHASVDVEASASSGSKITYRGTGNARRSVSSGGEVMGE